MDPEQRVRDLPSEAERGQARAPVPEPAERVGVAVLDANGQRVGEVTDAAAPLQETSPRVIIGLDEDVRERLGLRTAAVDVEALLLRKEEDGSVRLLEPLTDVLRREGFVV
jgi:hypothetical protein